MHITRKAHIDAAHRLHNPEMSDELNGKKLVQFFGRNLTQT